MLVWAQFPGLFCFCFFFFLLFISTCLINCIVSSMSMMSGLYFKIRYTWYQCLWQTSGLYIQIVYLVDVFNMQVRPREIYWIQKLNLAVWVLNCIVACAPHLRKVQMNSETQWSISAAASSPNPSHSLMIQRGHELEGSETTIKVERALFQPWVIKENTYFRTSWQSLGFLFLLEPQCSLQFLCTQILD